MGHVLDVLWWDLALFRVDFLTPAVGFGACGTWVDFQELLTQLHDVSGVKAG